MEWQQVATADKKVVWKPPAKNRKHSDSAKFREPVSGPGIMALDQEHVDYFRFGRDYKS